MHSRLVSGEGYPGFLFPGKASYWSGATLSPAVFLPSSRATQSFPVEPQLESGAESLQNRVVLTSMWASCSDLHFLHYASNYVIYVVLSRH